MWRYWLECWQEVKEATEGYRRIWVINGDAIDYDAKNRSNQYITNNKAQVLRIATDVLEPGLDVADSVIVVKGTPAHTGKDGELEEAIAQDLTTAKWYSDKAAAWPAVVCRVGGVRVDIAHHCSIGRLPHTLANGANRIAHRVKEKHINAGHKAPHLAIRSHVHQSVDSGDNYMTRAITTPCWQLTTTYGARIDADYPHIGMIAVLINGERYDIKKWIVKLGAINPWAKRL